MQFDATWCFLVQLGGVDADWCNFALFGGDWCSLVDLGAD